MPKRTVDDSTDVPLETKEDDDDLVCGACLSELFTPDHPFLGVPKDCPHLFHWDCLTNWASMQNACPQCKQRFRVAGKYDSVTRALIASEPFRKRDRVGRVDDDTEEPDLPVEVCEKCKCPGSDEDMILCDGMDFTCNAIFHYSCVGFDAVPPGLWFCQNCLDKGFVPKELLQSSSPPSTSKKSRKPTRPEKNSSVKSPSRPPSSLVMSAPQLFPRQLHVLPEAMRKDRSLIVSSRVPQNLQISFDLNLPPAHAAPPEDTRSVFARFRERRLELKRQKRDLQ